MVTIVNSPQPTNEDSGSNWFIPIVLIILLFIVIYYWGGAFIRRFGTGTDITIPSKIDVNVNDGVPAPQPSGQ